MAAQGFAHFWGVTISSVATIFILLAVGLAVDNSAHIAHIAVLIEGTSTERAVGALRRIGPSVFNAVVSTIIAVAAVAFSSSFVFRVFFKVRAGKKRSARAAVAHRPDRSATPFLSPLLGHLHGRLRC